ncbi:DNA/RNA helicase [Komagataeibacter oboediens DSM 11826]|uniref:DNA helicase n=1 Tax=Komagataeibacter oboediens TaxID=65958 RepID=A0A318R5T1_9PROT|nr:DUF927 domain-containing protein [Komagataeibacter oboediens]PYD81513.1 DNA helicase [Komagataeibacter oboediens]GBR28625.1 DNA/RNA helicase [Komagataeibacter oboediens DSM 11826]
MTGITSEASSLPAMACLSGAAPLAPLTDEEKAKAQTIGGVTGEQWEPITPAPCEPELPRGASFLWVYRDAEGRPLCARFRKEREDGGKDILPLSYGRRVWTDSKGNRHDGTGWHWKQGRKPLPLYGLDQLAAFPDVPVLLVEGEKTADAAARLFPDYVVMTSQGGSKAAANNDWSPLAGRSVTIWPDNDDAGSGYADAVIAALEDAGAAVVRTVAVPDNLPPGWDLADDVPLDLTGGEDTSDVDFLRPYLDQATPAVANVRMPHGYSMERGGLYFTEEQGGDLPPKKFWICIPFNVIAETRDVDGNGWGVLISWLDPDGRPHQWALPRRMVHGDGKDIAGELEDAGFGCAVSGTRFLRQFFSSVHTVRRLRCVDKSGWYHDNGNATFVLPNGVTVGAGRRDVVFQTTRMARGAEYGTGGTLTDWQRDIAAYAVGNSRLAFSLSVAFCGPLLDLMGEQSGGFHIVGKSQSGKSTSLFAAGSVWGKGDRDGQVRSWRGTSNGTEGIASETSDTLLVLDEMGQANSREVGEITYMLANNSGKQRAGRNGEARARKSWRVLFLSTGEITLATKMGEAGQRPMAGQEVRLVNVQADAGAGMGLFENLHDMASPGDLADHIRRAARTSYGTASRAWLQALVMDRNEDEAALTDTIKQIVARFEEQALPDAAPVDGQVRSVVRRFGLVAAAGEMATAYGVLPWQRGEATRAALVCFRSWLDDRGGTQAAEDRTAIEQVRLFIEEHGESRFTLLGGLDGDGDDSRSRTINRAGYRRKVTTEGGAEKWEYLIFPAVWREVVCKGLDARRAAQSLIAAGYLNSGGGGSPTSVIKDPEKEKAARFYVVNGEIVDGGN